LELTETPGLRNPHNVAAQSDPIEVPKSQIADAQDLVLFPTSSYIKLNPDIDIRTSPIVINIYGTIQIVLSIASYLQIPKSEGSGTQLAITYLSIKAQITKAMAEKIYPAVILCNNPYFLGKRGYTKLANIGAKIIIKMGLIIEIT
jgi:hypothetical protein